MGINKADDTGERAKGQAGNLLRVWFGKIYFNGNDFEKPRILPVVTEGRILSDSGPSPTSSNDCFAPERRFLKGAHSTESQSLPTASEGLHGLTVFPLLFCMSGIPTWRPTYECPLPNIWVPLPARDTYKCATS